MVEDLMIYKDVFIINLKRSGYLNDMKSLQTKVANKQITTYNITTEGIFTQIYPIDFASLYNNVEAIS